MRTIYKNPLTLLLPLIVIGVVVLSAGVFWGEENEKVSCEYEKDFISLFQEIEAAGYYESIWIEAEGDSQFVKHSPLVILGLKQGQIPFAKVNSLFEEIDRKRVFQLKDFYPPTDPNMEYESGYGILIICKDGKFKRIIFHPSISKKPLDEIIDLIRQTIVLFPESPLYGLFVNSSEMLLHNVFPDKLNWHGLIHKREKRAYYKFSENQLKEYPEVFNAILKPEAFIYISPKNEKDIRTLSKGKEQFYINYKNKDYIIRLFDRKKL